MAIALTMALAMVAFLGMAVNANVEPPLTAPVVTVTDTFAPEDDMNAYVGDTFTFMVDGYDAPHNNSNISAMIAIGENTPVAMEWNATSMMWVYEWMVPVDPSLVGTHMVNFTVKDINNETNMNYTDTTMITLWHPVMLDSTFELPDFHEDTMTLWNLSDAFLPEMDQAGNMLTFGVGPEGFPADWTFTPVDHMGYTHWEVTPPMDFEGTAMVNVTATDTNGVMAYYMFDIEVIGENDAPMIEYLMVGEDQVDIEWWNYTWTEDDMNMSEWRWVANLTMDEDAMIEVMVNAMDVETPMWNLTYDLMVDDVPVTVEPVLNETNETIPYNFTIIGDENANGMYWGMLNVSDDEGAYHMIYLYFIIEPVNDAPMGEFGDEYEMRFEVLTEEEVNVSVSVSDVDMDELTVTWKIDGETVDGWNELYFLYNWTEEGLYNISAEVSDGIDTVQIGYFHVNVTIANVAPVINSVTGPTEEVEEGKEFTLSVNATDADGDTLTITWTHDQDSAWQKTGSPITVTDLIPGTYVFTVTVEDPSGETDSDTISVTIKEKEDEDGEFPILIVIVVVVILLIILLIIIFVVVKGKKKEEEVPEEPMGEEMPMEEGMEGEGMEEPMPEEEPMGEEMPAEEPMGEEMPVEEEVAEEPMEQPVEEEMPVPPAPAPPEQPMPPMPPQ